jgi:hypothetical protein
MEFNRFEGEVQGINQLQDQYEQKYKPGDYVPPPVVMYWSFRVMVGAGLLMIAISLFALFIDLKNLYNKFSWFIKLLPLAIALPYLANTTGWIITEMGRFPWIVYTLVKLEDGVSIILKNSTILISLIGFMLVYGLLIIATLYLMFKYAKAGPMAAPVVLEEVTPSWLTCPKHCRMHFMTLNTLCSFSLRSFIQVSSSWRSDFGVGFLPFLVKRSARRTIINSSDLLMEMRFGDCCWEQPCSLSQLVYDTI